MIVMIPVVWLGPANGSQAWAQTAAAPSGSGTSGDPYLIATLDNLYWITQNSSSWGAYFKQTADINASATLDWDSGSGFSPIGTTTTKFTGTYDGDGYTISSLHISRSGMYLGMFGYITATETDTATIKNIGVVNLGFQTSHIIGGLVGQNEGGRVSNCYSTGVISGSGISTIGGLVGNNSGGTVTNCHSNVTVVGGNYVGGLSGQNTGSINNCYSSGNVNSTGDNVGGLVGYNSSPGTVSSCYSTGSVSNGTHVGGLVGWNQAAISDCYSTGSVSGVDAAGGLLGINYQSSATVNTSYSTGSVSSGGAAGGLVGANILGATVGSSFWDTQRSNQSSSAGGTGKTTAQMLDSNNFTNFDFENLWDMADGHGFPFLRNVSIHRVNVMEITGSEGWRLISSPMDNFSYGTLLENLWTQGFTGSNSPNFGASNVYTWNEETRQFESISGASDVPGAGTGILVYVYDDQDFDETEDGFPKTLFLQGNEDTSAVSIPLSYTEGESDSAGWNLVGNPYPFPINWNASSGWIHTNLDASFYVWNASVDQYQSHNGSVGTLPDSIIAPGQAFWVKADASGPALTLNHDEVRDDGGVLLKKQPIPELRFTMSDGRFSNSAIVMFSEQSSIQKDQMDAYKLQPLSSEYLSLFSQINDGTALDINALPTDLEEPVSVEMNYQLATSKSGAQSARLEWNISAFPVGWKFKLTDNQAGETINLNKTSAYEFDIDNTSREAGASARHSAAELRNVDEPSKGSGGIATLTHGVVSPQVIRAKTGSSGTASSRFTLTIIPESTVSTKPTDELPSEVTLTQNYPNPFNPSTVIRYQLPVNSEVTLEVFDMLGRKVAALVDGRGKAGMHEITFNARNLASGMYIYRLKAGDKIITKKLTLIK